MAQTYNQKTSSQQNQTQSEQLVGFGKNRVELESTHEDDRVISLSDDEECSAVVDQVVIEQSRKGEFAFDPMGGPENLHDEEEEEQKEEE